MSNATNVLDTPTMLSPTQVMNTLSAGHGYRWRVLLRSPNLIAHGHSSKNGMPALSIIDRKILVWSDEEEQVSRLRRMLDILSRTMVRRSP